MDIKTLKLRGFIGIQKGLGTMLDKFMEPAGPGATQKHGQASPGTAKGQVKLGSGITMGNMKIVERSDGLFTVYRKKDGKWVYDGTHDREYFERGHHK